MDDPGRLLYLAHRNSSQVLAEFRYTLDDAGQRMRVQETIDGKSRTIDYSYDKLYRLTGEIVTNAHADLGGDYSVSYTFDKVGNRLRKTRDGVTTSYGYNNRDQLVREQTGSDPARTYTYDRNGALVATSDGSSYAYDLRGRMTLATVSGQTVRYGYDHEGQRISQRNVGTGAVEQYLVDPINGTGYGQVLEQRDGSGNLARSFTIGHQVLSQATGSVVQYLLGDALGSTRALVDATGQIIDGQVHAYDAFGLKMSPGTILTPLGFAREWIDQYTGLSYNRDRWLDLSLGRFMQRDRYLGRISQPLTLHSQLYGNGDPANSVDPSGHMTLSEKLVVSGLLIGGALGAAIGGYIGYSTTGKIFSLQTIGYAVVGGLAGAAIGAELGALIAYFCGASGGLSAASGAFGTITKMAPKLVQQLARVFTASSLESLGIALTKWSMLGFGAGVTSGVIAGVLTPDAYQEPVGVTALATYGSSTALVVGYSWLVGVVPGGVQVGWVFVQGFNLGYFTTIQVRRALDL